jgi:hypothetical protein
MRGGGYKVHKLCYRVGLLDAKTAFLLLAM